MVASEVDDEVLTPQAGQFQGGGLAVVPVELPAAGQRKAEPHGQRGIGPAEDTEASVSLADVVEKGGSNDVELATPSDGDKGCMEPVSLVWVRL